MTVNGINQLDNTEQLKQWLKRISVSKLQFPIITSQPCNLPGCYDSTIAKGFTISTVFLNITCATIKFYPLLCY